MNKSDHKSVDEQTDIESSINQSLDQSVENLSPEIRRSLNRIRIKATTKSKPRLVLIPLASALSLSLAVFMGWQLIPQPAAEETVFAEVLEEDFEMLEELEFVYWISEGAESAQL